MHLDNFKSCGGVATATLLIKTDTAEQSHWEATSSSANQDISRILFNPNARHL